MSSMIPAPSGAVTASTTRPSLPAVSTRTVVIAITASGGRGLVHLLADVVGQLARALDDDMRRPDGNLIAPPRRHKRTASLRRLRRIRHT
jgi:hypothetical protein